MNERRRVVEAALGRRLERYREVEEGWDSVVAVAEKEWIFRFPRRPQIERRLASEIALLPELAPTLPVTVPRFEHVVRVPLLCVGYRMIEGEPFTAAVPPEQVAAFLSALHRFDVERAEELGVQHSEWSARYVEQCDEFAREVLPLLDGAERGMAHALFAEAWALRDFTPAVVHNDLGPEHMLCRGRRLVGVIDWGDVASATLQSTSRGSCTGRRPHTAMRCSRPTRGRPTSGCASAPASTTALPRGTTRTTASRATARATSKRGYEESASASSVLSR